MILYRSRRVRQFIGGKYGYVSGLFFGKKWVRLSEAALMWDENWDVPQNCLVFQDRFFKIDEDGNLLQCWRGDLAETWQIVTKLN